MNFGRDQHLALFSHVKGQAPPEIIDRWGKMLSSPLRVSISSDAPKQRTFGYPNLFAFILYTFRRFLLIKKRKYKRNKREKIPEEGRRKRKHESRHQAITCYTRPLWWVHSHYRQKQAENPQEREVRHVLGRCRSFLFLAPLLFSSLPFLLLFEGMPNCERFFLYRCVVHPARWVGEPNQSVEGKRGCRGHACPVGSRRKCEVGVSKSGEI